MSIELATAMYDAIPKITHLRTYLYLRTIAENTDPDGYCRLTYSKWKDVGLHAFILNVVTEEAIKLGFISIARETKIGIIGADEGGKGSKRLYKLTLENIGKIAPNTEPKQEKVEPVIEPEPIAPEKVETKRSPMPATKFNKGKKISAEKPKVEKKPVPAKKATKPAPKKEAPKPKVAPKKAPVKKASKKK